MSMDAIYDLAPEPGTDRIMLVMLPAAKARPQDLVQCGFVRALRERSVPIDVVVVGAHLGHSLGRSFGRRLKHDIIAPARARNYQRIWLMGISLGGRHTQNIDPVLHSKYLLENRDAGVRRMLSNSFGFGGSNCSLVLGAGG